MDTQCLGLMGWKPGSAQILNYWFEYCPLQAPAWVSSSSSSLSLLSTTSSPQSSTFLPSANLTASPRPRHANLTGSSSPLSMNTTQVTPPPPPYFHYKGNVHLTHLEQLMDQSNKCPLSPLTIKEKREMDPDLSLLSWVKVQVDVMPEWSKLSPYWPPWHTWECAITNLTELPCQPAKANICVAC